MSLTFNRTLHETNKTYVAIQFMKHKKVIFESEEKKRLSKTVSVKMHYFKLTRQIKKIQNKECTKPKRWYFRVKKNTTKTTKLPLILLHFNFKYDFFPNLKGAFSKRSLQAISLDRFPSITTLPPPPNLELKRLKKVNLKLLFFLKDPSWRIQHWKKILL